MLAASCASASSFSYTGSLDPSDANDFALFEFTLSVPAGVNIQTWGYGGGTNAAGAVIAAGGFDPYVSLFQGKGNMATFLASNDDGLCPPAHANPACRDSTLTLLNPAAGDYTVALSVAGNMSFAENQGTGTLGDGFIGLGNYYDGASGSVRTSAYAIDIASPGIAPEPPTLTLVALAALLPVFFKIKTKKEESHQ
jgi:hypothetical protein